MVTAEHVCAVQYVFQGKQHLFQIHIGRRLFDVLVRCFRHRGKHVASELRHLADVLCRLFETLVFLQATNQLGPRVLFILVVTLRSWQQHA